LVIGGSLELGSWILELGQRASFNLLLITHHF